MARNYQDDLDTAQATIEAILSGAITVAQANAIARHLTVKVAEINSVNNEHKRRNDKTEIPYCKTDARKNK